MAHLFALSQQEVKLSKRYWLIESLMGRENQNTDFQNQYPMTAREKYTSFIKKTA